MIRLKECRILTEGYQSSEDSEHRVQKWGQIRLLPLVSSSNLYTYPVTCTSSGEVPPPYVLGHSGPPFLMEADIPLHFNDYVRDSIPIYELALDKRQLNRPVRPLVI